MTIQNVIIYCDCNDFTKRDNLLWLQWLVQARRFLRQLLSHSIMSLQMKVIFFYSISWQHFLTAFSHSILKPSTESHTFDSIFPQHHKTFNWKPYFWQHFPTAYKTFNWKPYRKAPQHRTGWLIRQCEQQIYTCIWPGDIRWTTSY